MSGCASSVRPGRRETGQQRRTVLDQLADGLAVRHRDNPAISDFVDRLIGQHEAHELLICTQN
jgi:hypothetical protein